MKRIHNSNTKGVSAAKIVSEADRVKMFKDKLEYRQANEDTNIRKAIQEVITHEISNRKSRDEIIETLKQNEKFAKYEMFFESWTDHRLGKGEQPDRER